MNFEVDPDNFLSFQYDDYKQKSYSTALSDPAKYFKLRSEVNSAVKRAALKNLYATFFKVLSTGVLDAINGAGGCDIAAVVGIAPNYPAQKASDLALDACSTLMPVIDKVIEILLPLHATETAKTRITELSVGKAG